MESAIPSEKGNDVHAKLLSHGMYGIIALPLYKSIGREVLIAKSINDALLINEPLFPAYLMGTCANLNLRESIIIRSVDYLA